jgi:hypothetical protein
MDLPFLAPVPAAGDAHHFVALREPTSGFVGQ